jgi:hypothetical protein
MRGREGVDVMTDAGAHLSAEQLLAYWLHETGPQETEAADEHLMQCDRCGGEFDAMLALGRGIRDALRAGEVAAAIPGSFAKRLATPAGRVRSYHLPAGGSVRCTIAPEDEMLLVQLDAPLRGIDRLDAVVTTSLEPDAQHRLPDLPFDPEGGSVFWVQQIARIRQMPAHTTSILLVTPEGSGERMLGRYTFMHEPWPASS